MDEIRINVPEGMEIDKENSTFECIKFKPKVGKRWRDDKKAKVKGYYINSVGVIQEFAGFNEPRNKNVFTTEKLAKSALAMAQISQIMTNDERFGGPVTDEEWKQDAFKNCISREEDDLIKESRLVEYCFLAFHTEEQRDLFLEENEDLVKQYLMID